MAKRLLTDADFQKIFSTLSEDERTQLRVMYVSVDTPRFGVGAFFDSNNDISVRFIASISGNPLDENVCPENSVEFTSIKTVPLNMYNIAASLVSRMSAFISEDRTIQSLVPNNPSIASYVMYKED